jgi:hypothetical protein
VTDEGFGRGAGVPRAPGRTHTFTSAKERFIFGHIADDAATGGRRQREGDTARLRGEFLGDQPLDRVEDELVGPTTESGFIALSG